jgi:hypothetical protein
MSRNAEPSEADALAEVRRGCFVLTVERPISILSCEWSPISLGESFPEIRSMDDLPLYQSARKIVARTSRLRIRSFVVRTLETAAATTSAMESKVPQFFLRNIARVEMSLPDEPEFQTIQVRDLDAEQALASIRSLRYEPPQLIRRWNMDEVKNLRVFLRRVLHDEDWRRRFGRELKESIRGPLFKYDPDAPAS